MRNWRLLTALCILEIASLVCGCSDLFNHSVNVSSDYYPSVFKADKNTQPLALWLPSAFCDTTIVTHPSTGYASAHSFSFKVGPALCVALEGAANPNFDTVEVFRSSPVRDVFPRILKYTMKDLDLNLSYEPNGQGSLRLTVGILVEALDGSSFSPINGILVRKTLDETTKPGGSFSEHEVVFADMIEGLFQEIGDEIATALIEGLAN